MVSQIKPVTIEEFTAYVDRPENDDKLFELIDGEIIEVSPGRTYHSGIGIIVAVAVHSFCRERNLSCYVSGADGAYKIGEHVVVPDFAYKMTPLSEEYPDPDLPLWAVEVISPTDRATNIRSKRQIYIDAGILYWEVYPEPRRIDVYAPGQGLRTVDIDGVLDGGDALPGFSLSARELLSR